MANNEYKLTSELLKLSFSQVWDIAKKEWNVIQIYLDDEAQTCLCGHYPIKEVCIIKNNITQQFAEIGNCCVKKFIQPLCTEYDTTAVFQGIKRLLADISNSVNRDTIHYANKLNIWTDKNIEFYLSIYRKRTLTPKQLKYKQDLNQKLLSAVIRNKG